MTINQARNNLLNLLNHPDLKLNWHEHNALRQSLGLLYEQAKEKEEDGERIESVPETPKCEP